MNFWLTRDKRNHGSEYGIFTTKPYKEFPGDNRIIWAALHGGYMRIPSKAIPQSLHLKPGGGPIHVELTIKAVKK